MSVIVKKFAEFVGSHKFTVHAEHVNISEIVQMCDNLTPTVQLKLSTVSASITHLAEQIIRNLCKYAKNSRFPIFGLRAILAIISKDVALDDVIMQQILLIHTTKMILNMDYQARIIQQIESITCEIGIDQHVEEWILIAYQAIGNDHVKTLIDDLMIETLGSESSNRIFETKNSEIDIVFFKSHLETIRGYSGFNTVYVSRNYFEAKRLKKLESDLILIDIVTLVIHELAHVRIRQVFDDINMSTPLAITEPHNTGPEFGRMVERKLFKFAVDWEYSSTKGAFPASYISDFLKAIRSNEKLPVVPESCILYPRPNLVTFYGVGGADISEEYVFE